MTETTPPDPTAPEMRPGDIANSGRANTGDYVCPRCNGTGEDGDADCPICDGTGRVTEGVDGA